MMENWPSFETLINEQHSIAMDLISTPKEAKECIERTVQCSYILHNELVKMQPFPVEINGPLVLIFWGVFTSFIYALSLVAHSFAVNSKVFTRRGIEALILFARVVEDPLLGLGWFLSKKGAPGRMFKGEIGQFRRKYLRKHGLKADKLHLINEKLKNILPDDEKMIVLEKYPEIQQFLDQLYGNDNEYPEYSFSSDYAVHFNLASLSGLFEYGADSPSFYIMPNVNRNFHKMLLYDTALKLHNSNVTVGVILEQNFNEFVGIRDRIQIIEIRQLYETWRKVGYEKYGWGPDTARNKDNSDQNH